MLSVLFSLTFPAAAFFIVYVLLLLGGTEDEDAAAGGWRALSGGKRFCYLASALLPPLGFLLLCAYPDVSPAYLLARRWHILLLPALSFLLGLGNLALCLARRLPQKHGRRRHILLTLSLIPSLALMDHVWILWTIDYVSRNSNW